MIVLRQDGIPSGPDVISMPRAVLELSYLVSF